jgi:hypothetical protein
MGQTVVLLLWVEREADFSWVTDFDCGVSEYRAVCVLNMLWREAGVARWQVGECSVKKYLDLNTSKEEKYYYKCDL